MPNLNNLKTLLEEGGRGSQQRLSKAINISTGNISDWFNPNKSATPNASTLCRIAEYYDCSIDFILGRTNKRQLYPITHDNIIYLPLVNQKASAGIGKESVEDDNEDIRAFLPIKVPEKATHAIAIEGISMQPRYYDGQIVFIQAKQQCNDGDCGVFNVTVNGVSKVYCKQLKYDEFGKQYLHSLNIECGDPEFSEAEDVHIECIGKILS